MTKVERNKKQIARRSSHFCKQLLRKLSSSAPVAGLHSSILSYAELIDYGNAAIQQFKHFNIYMASSLGLYDKKMNLPSRYQLILFSSNLNILQQEGNKIKNVLPGTQSLSVPAVARLVNHSSEFQLQLELEGSYVNGNCTEDADFKESMYMHASLLSRE